LADIGRIRADIALVPIGGTYTMDPFAAANAVKEMRPKYAIPMHYNTTERHRAGRRRVYQRLGQPDQAHRAQAGPRRRSFPERPQTSLNLDLPILSINSRGVSA